MSSDEVMKEAFKVGGRGLVEFRQLFMPADNELKPAEFHWRWSDSMLRSDRHITTHLH